MSTKDLPVISGPNDSTRIDVPVQKPAVPAAAPALRRNPASEIRRPAAPAAPAQDPRSASEARKSGSVVPKAPAAPAAAAPSAEEEDPEKLLREYAERQKTKVLRLEQQVQEQRKVVAERDGFKSKAEALAKELQDARRQVEASAKQEEILKDLQAKVDASLLATTMANDENGKLKARVQELAEAVRKAEARAAQAEKSLLEAQKALASQSEGRREAEARIAAALQALQGPSVDAAVTRPVPQAAKPPVTAAPRPVPAVVRK
jgi:predicted ribosome quality control (RQC) complex YloA/Tae2 family protein